MAKKGTYLTRERRRFSAAIIWSVEVGIQRRTVAHRDAANDFFLAFAFVLGVSASGVWISEELSVCNAIDEVFVCNPVEELSVELFVCNTVAIKLH